MTEEIRFERRGALGIAILDRQPALNALTRGMVQSLSAQLAAWRLDPEVAAVLVKAAPGRAFCAGGDIRAVTEGAARDGVEAVTPFFREEYRLNWRIHTYPKPYIALLDGITMGGGVGISVHGAFRVLTERTLFAMPETAIGFFPDVGGGWFLPRCPGEVGTWLGLAGARLGPADCLAAGIGTHFVPTERLPALEEALAANLAGGAGQAEVADALAAHAAVPSAGTLDSLRPRIDGAFAADSVEAIVAALEQDGSSFAAEQLAALGARSPLALKATLAQLRRGRGASIEDCLRLEYRMVHRFLAGHDFSEGVRALLVDKDKSPRWQPATLAGVTPAMVEAAMAPLEAGDLGFDWEGV